ncbi:hypothetical protein ACFY1V_19875 [Streptomyces sp. NPDC001255]|uniref:hypothetical protein n=1 Tax=Streptomyces sp. NPDC001255 TaxID=3364550 RepID=UPI00367F6D92
MTAPATGEHPGTGPRLSRRALLALAGGTALAGTLPATASAAPAPLAPASATDSLFSRFAGTCQAGADAAGIDESLGLTWNRQDVSWAALQPAEGTWDDAALDTLVTAFETASAGGVSTLPVLGYTAPWAARRDPYDFTVPGQHVAIGPVLSETATTFRRRVTVTATDGTPVSDGERELSRDKTPPADPGQWTAFVQRAVDRLTASTADVPYFQLWNEAYWGTPFWNSGLDDYFATVHEPAAAVVRAAGARTVYGGWPAGAPTSELLRTLDARAAWDTVDVLDIHYQAINTMPALLTAAAAHSATPALWQSEYGFTTDWASIGNVYPRVFSWALREGLADHPDMVKMFWFAWRAPDDPTAYGYRKCLLSGSTPSGHGRALKALTTLLDSPTVSRWSDFTTTPVLGFTLDGAVSSAEGFTLADGSHVLALHLRNGPSGPVDHVVLDSPALSGASAVRRVDLYGNTTPLTPAGTTVTVPAHDPDTEAETANAATGVRTVYVALDA